MCPPSQGTPRLTSWPIPSLPLVCGDWHEADLWSQICCPWGADLSAEQPGVETRASTLSPSGWYSWPCLALTSGSELKVLNPETIPHPRPHPFSSPLELGSVNNTKMLMIPDLNVDVCVCVCVCACVCVYICSISSLSIHLFMDIKQAVFMSGYCEQGCYKHRGVCISLNYNFVQICAQDWDC